MPEKLYQRRLLAHHKPIQLEQAGHRGQQAQQTVIMVIPAHWDPLLLQQVEAVEVAQVLALPRNQVAQVAQPALERPVILYPQVEQVQEVLTLVAPLVLQVREAIAFWVAQLLPKPLLTAWWPVMLDKTMAQEAEAALHQILAQV